MKTAFSSFIKPVTETQHVRLNLGTYFLEIF